MGDQGQSTTRRLPLGEAATSRHPHGPEPGRRHVLVVANEMLAGPTLRDAIAQRGGARARIDILAPVLCSRSHYGDPDPCTALEDELRDFGADEVIVVTHPRERANWVESGELERLRAELNVSVTHVVADREHASVEVER